MRRVGVDCGKPPSDASGNAQPKLTAFTVSPMATLQRTLDNRFRALHPSAMPTGQAKVLVAVGGGLLLHPLLSHRPALLRGR